VVRAIILTCPGFGNIKTSYRLVGDLTYAPATISLTPYREGDLWKCSQHYGLLIVTEKEYSFVGRLHLQGSVRTLCFNPAAVLRQLAAHARVLVKAFTYERGYMSNAEHFFQTSLSTTRGEFAQKVASSLINVLLLMFATPWGNCTCASSSISNQKQRQTIYASGTQRFTYSHASLAAAYSFSGIDDNYFCNYSPFIKCIQDFEYICVD